MKRLGVVLLGIWVGAQADPNECGRINALPGQDTQRQQEIARQIDMHEQAIARLYQELDQCMQDQTQKTSNEQWQAPR